MDRLSLKTFQEGVSLKAHQITKTQLNKESVQEIFQRFGIIVVTDVLTQEEVDNFVNALWNNPNLLAKNGIQRDDPLTWESKFWPVDPNNKGFMPLDLNFQPSWDLRQHPAIHDIFTMVLDTPELICSLDRVGCMRPTKDILTTQGKKLQKKNWKTDQNFLHWDQNPWSCPSFQGIQGLITLTNHTETSGGFHCTPGFHHLFATWGADNLEFKQSGSLVDVPPHDSLRDCLTKITMPPGSLLVWDSRIPHGNFPNDDDTFRIVQYLTMYPKEPEKAEKTQRLIKMVVSSSVVFSELGKRLTGCDPA